jgi:hypothetical protein
VWRSVADQCIVGCWPLYLLTAEGGEPGEVGPGLLLDGPDAQGLAQSEGKERITRHVPPPPVHSVISLNFTKLRQNKYNKYYCIIEKRYQNEEKVNAVA